MNWRTRREKRGRKRGIRLGYERSGEERVRVTGKGGRHNVVPREVDQRGAVFFSRDGQDVWCQDQIQIQRQGQSKVDQVRGRERERKRDEMKGRRGRESNAPILRIGKSGESRQMPMYFAPRSNAFFGLPSCMWPESGGREEKTSR